MTWTIKFIGGGGEINAPTAEDVLDAWRLKSWSRWTVAEWPEVLAKRAYVWSGAMIDSTLPASELLAELDKAGMIRLTVTTEGSK